MTPRGRKPLPTSLKRLRGTLRPHRTNPNEPVVAAAVPEAPDWLVGDARREWDRILPQLTAAGLVTRLDRAALVAYCSAWGDLCEAYRTLQQHGSTYVNEKGAITAHPMLKVAERARGALRAFANEFGLSPSARARVAATPVPLDDDSAADARRFFPLVHRGGRP